MFYQSMTRSKQSAGKRLSMKVPRITVSGKGLGTPSVLGKIKRAHRFRPGTVALREIRKLQREVSVAIKLRLIF